MAHLPYSDADLLGLPTIPVPPEVTRVEGCSCGGLDWHLRNCALFSALPERARESVEAAHQRLRDHTADLNERLQAALAAATPPAAEEQS